MANQTLAQMMYYATVKIISCKNGNVDSTGTGFFYRTAITEDVHQVAIFTNKHVVAEADEIRISCHKTGDVINGTPAPSSEHFEVKINLQKTGLLMHPDEDIDLCAIPFRETFISLVASSRIPFFIPLTSEEIPSSEEWDSFDAIEDVTMIGYPRGLHDEVNNLPLVRRGITATPLAVDYNGKAEFLIDMACFPGSSGSPVLVYDRTGYLDRKTNTFLMGRQRIAFVGILYSGPLISNSGTIVLGEAPTVQVASMMHLGYVIRSTAIFPIEEQLRALK